MLSQYPIMIPLRAPLLILEWILAFICFEIGFIFLINYTKQKQPFKTKREVSFASLYFGLSIRQFFIVKADFYSSITVPCAIWEQGSERLFYLNLGYISLLLALLIFILIWERNEKCINYKKYFIKLYLITMLIVLMLFFIDLSLYLISFLLFWSLFLSFFLIYIFYFMIKQTPFKRSLLLFLLIFCFLTLGILFSNEIIYTILGIEVRIIGVILQFITVILLFVWLRNLPIKAELDWLEKIQELYILNKEGACLYHKSFINEESAVNEQLVTGAIASLNVMLKELTSSENKGTATIEKKDKIVNIYSGKYISGVLFSHEKLKIINYYLKSFIEKIESIYRNVLIDWEGDIEIFRPIEDIMKETFYK